MTSEHDYFSSNKLLIIMNRSGQIRDTLGQIRDTFSLLRYGINIYKIMYQNLHISLN